MSEVAGFFVASCAVGRTMMGSSDDWIQVCSRPTAHQVEIHHDVDGEPPQIVYLCCHHMHQFPDSAFDDDDDGFDPSLN